jgi:hypothetical protein
MRRSLRLIPLFPKKKTYGFGRRKRTFLLVEVIVGLAIFALCALPLIRQPFIQTQTSYERLFEAEASRQAEVSRCAILADLQAGNIPWTSLPNSHKGNFTLPGVTFELDLGKGPKRTYEQSATISLDCLKKTSVQQDARLLKLTLSFSEKGKTQKAKIPKFTYLLTVVGPSESIVPQGS